MPDVNEGEVEMPPGQWRPGVDVGNFVRRRWSPVLPQTRVLVCNLMLGLEKIAPQKLKTLLDSLPSMPESSLTSIRFSVASRLLRLPETTIRTVYHAATGLLLAQGSMFLVLIYNFEYYMTCDCFFPSYVWHPNKGEKEEVVSEPSRSPCS